MFQSCHPWLNLKLIQKPLSQVGGRIEEFDFILGLTSARFIKNNKVLTNLVHGGQHSAKDESVDQDEDTIVTLDSSDPKNSLPDFRRKST